MDKNAITVGKLSASRMSVIDYLNQVSKLNLVRGLFDIDVTDIRSAIRRYRRETGKRLSLSVYLMYIYALAIKKNITIQRSTYGKRKYMDFSNVDMNMTVERNLNGEPMVITEIIRSIEDRSLSEIMDEVDEAVYGENDQMFSNQKKFSTANLAMLLPRFLKQIILRYSILHNPKVRTTLFGTVSFTAVSMFARGKGWAVAMSPHPMNMILGGIEKQYKSHRGKMELREVASITITMNHDLVDGAVGTRFINDFKVMCEGLYGIEEFARK